MILKSISVESFESKPSPIDTVHFLKQLIQDNQPGTIENFQRLFSTDEENGIIDFSFEIAPSDFSSDFSGVEWVNYCESAPIPPRMENVRQIRFDMSVEQSKTQPFIKKLQFYLENILLFTVKSHPGDNQRQCFRIYTHPMTPDEIKETFIYDRYDRFEDQADESYVYEGYDADLMEDWSDSYNDYESDRFLDAGMDDEDRYAPPYEDKEKMDWLLRNYACQTDFELVLPAQLPQPGISSKNLLKQMKIVNDPFEVIPTHSEFFDFIMQVYLISFEILRKIFSRSDFEAHVSSIMTLVHKKKYDPSDNNPFGPVA